MPPSIPTPRAILVTMERWGLAGRSAIGERVISKLPLGGSQQIAKIERIGSGGTGEPWMVPGGGNRPE